MSWWEFDAHMDAMEEDFERFALFMEAQMQAEHERQMQEAYDRDMFRLHAADLLHAVRLRAGPVAMVPAGWVAP